MALLKVENLSCSYGNKTILKDCSFDVEAGQIVGILGANGCGKTTLLKCICQTIPYSGNIILEDASEAKNTASLSAKELAKHMSYIPQNLCPVTKITSPQTVKR
ncbi:MAG: ABC transporter ATP-binding protein [Clostridia bacterium]|nr:ABC transporter ATP-binding protein [Clostridia bacterium]